MAANSYGYLPNSKVKDPNQYTPTATPTATPPANPTGGTTPPLPSAPTVATTSTVATGATGLPSSGLATGSTTNTPPATGTPNTPPSASQTPGANPPPQTGGNTPPQAPPTDQTANATQAPPAAQPPAPENPQQGNPNWAGYSKTGNATVDGILAQMANNSMRYHDAKTPQEQDALHQTNVNLSDHLRSMGVDAVYNPSEGSWNVLTYDPVKPPEEWKNMSPDQVDAGVRTTTAKIGDIYDRIDQLTQQVATAGNVNVQAIVNGYLGNIAQILDQAQQAAQAEKDRGVNDPGLQSALAVLRDSAQEMRSQLEQDLQARGQTGGIAAKALANFDKGQSLSEGQVVGQYLSELTKRYSEAMQNIMNQRVAANTQAMQLNVSGELQNQQNKTQAMGIAIQGLNDLAKNIQDANYQNRMLDISNAELELKKQELGSTIVNNAQQNALETGKLNETVRANQATEKLQGQQLAETNRHNLVSESQETQKIDNDYDIALKQVGIAQQNANTAAKEADTRANSLIEDIRHNQASENLEGRRLDLQKAADAADQAYKDRSLDIEQAKADTTQNLQTLQIAAAHKDATKATLSSIEDKVQAGDMSAVDVLSRIDSVYSTLDIQPNNSNVGLEQSIFKDFMQGMVTKAQQENQGSPWLHNLYTAIGTNLDKLAGFAVGNWFRALADSFSPDSTATATINSAKGWTPGGTTNYTP